MSDDLHSAPTLTDVLAAFLGDAAGAYEEIEYAVLAVGCEPLDDMSLVETMLPESKIPIEDIVVWKTGFTNAPFLILSRAATPHPSDPDNALIFRTRRVFLTEIEERDLYEWVTNFYGCDAAGKKEESGGHYSWVWAWPTEDTSVLQDGMRLYVAGADNMMILERISAMTK